MMRLKLFLAAAIAVSGVQARGQGAAGAGFEVERYEVTLVPNLADTSVTGRETITLRSQADGLGSIVFSPNALVIDAATANGREVAVTSDTVGVSIVLPRPLARGTRTTLVLRYHGVPRRGVTITANAIYSSYFACDWMVCLQDSPGDKAWFALDLQVPAGMNSLATGRMIGERRSGSGAVIHRWRTRRPYSAYLFGFAVGRFTRASERSGGSELVYLSEGENEAELRRLFSDTPQMVAFFAGRAGVPLPDGRYAQLLVAGGEAQEAATYALIGREHFERSAADPASAWVVAHELAHMWWGNLVTAQTWQDFWLNEGITTFMTAAWKAKRFGASAYQAEMDHARARLSRAREAGWDRPLAFAGPYPNLGTRRAIQYSKGALFMDHLRRLIGEEAFWRGLRAYTRQHAGGTVTSIDLQRAMERAADRDLGPVFREWVYG